MYNVSIYSHFWSSSNFHETPGSHLEAKRFNDPEEPVVWVLFREWVEISYSHNIVAALRFHRASEVLLSSTPRCFSSWGWRAVHTAWARPPGSKGFRITRRLELDRRSMWWINLTKIVRPSSLFAFGTSRFNYSFFDISFYLCTPRAEWSWGRKTRQSIFKFAKGVMILSRLIPQRFPITLVHLTHCRGMIRRGRHRPAPKPKALFLFVIIHSLYRVARCKPKRRWSCFLLAFPPLLAGMSHLESYMIPNIACLN